MGNGPKLDVLSVGDLRWRRAPLRTSAQPSVRADSSPADADVSHRRVGSVLEVTVPAGLLALARPELAM